MKRLLFALTLVTLGSLVLPALARPAYACSCVALPAEAHVANADAIVVGKVIRLVEASERVPPVPGKSDGVIPDVDAVFLVQRYLKGSGPAEIVVDDPPSGGTCGFLDEDSLGEPYLLFLRGDESPLETDICSGSTLLEGKPADQQLLDRVLALTGRGALPEEHFPWVPIAVASGLGGALLVAASVLLLRRRIIGRG